MPVTSRARGRSRKGAAAGYRKKLPIPWEQLSQMIAQNQRFSQGVHKPLQFLKALKPIRRGHISSIKGETDTLPCHSHDILWYKLLKYGIRGKIINVIKSMYVNI